MQNRWFVFFLRKNYDDFLNTIEKWGYEKGHRAGYKTGFQKGLAKGRERFQKSPGWLRDEVHKKLDLMFKKDKYSDRARYRWLKQHSLTTSHMSEMSKEELLKINKLLNETLGDAVNEI